MNLIQLYTFLYLANIYLFQSEVINKLRVLSPLSTQKEKSKQESKILQILYSDSYSNNYYYTTLYLTDKLIKQTYIIETAIAIMSSPCAKCEYCGQHKKNYYDFSGKINNEMKCYSKLCKILPANSCWVNERNVLKKTCSYYHQKANGDGLRGYYIKDIVYFQQDKNLASKKKVYRSYALPLGCTLGEYGRYKEMKADGVMGLNNFKSSFNSILYNLKIINKNVFSLCLGLEGGYMSLGDIDTTYHTSKKIDYLPLINNTDYLINVTGIQLGNNGRSLFDLVGLIDSGSPFTFLPKNLFNILVTEFDQYCLDKKGNNKCGKFQMENEIGYCASFEDRESLFKTVNENWPVITLQLGKNIEFKWKPINYYYYYVKKNIRKACFGFVKHHSSKIILGSNFMHGYDMIFDIEKQLLGFVQADCSRRNIIYSSMKGVIKLPSSSKTVPEVLDKEIHKNENQDKFDFGDNDNKEIVEFIEGENKELEPLKDFKLIKFIILLIPILVIVISLLIAIIVLIRKRKDNSYQKIISEENKSLNPSQSAIHEEAKGANNLIMPQKSLIEEENDNKKKKSP